MLEYLTQMNWYDIHVSFSLKNLLMFGVKRVKSILNKEYKVNGKTKFL